MYCRHDLVVDKIDPEAMDGRLKMSMGLCVSPTLHRAYSEVSQRSQVGCIGAKNVKLFLREP